MSPPSAVAFGRVDYEPGGVFGPRTQPDVQLVVMERGALRVTTDGREQAVEAGQVACQWPGGLERYAFSPDRVSTHRWVALTFGDRPATRRWLRSQQRSAPPVRVETAVMRKLFDTAAAMQATDEPAVRVARTYLAMSYLAAYLLPDRTARGPAGSPLPEALRAMEAAIADRYGESITLSDLAKDASVSPPHLARLCRTHLDTTPMRLLWDFRVERGVELLRGTGLTIGEIAYRVGFANPFHFSRLCKARWGVSPSTLRRRAWGNEAGGAG